MNIPPFIHKDCFEFPQTQLWLLHCIPVGFELPKGTQLASSPIFVVFSVLLVKEVMENIQLRADPPGAAPPQSPLSGASSLDYNSSPLFLYGF